MNIMHSITVLDLGLFLICGLTSHGIAHVAKKSVVLSEVLSHHDEVFAEELGLMSQFKAKLVVKPVAPPCFLRQD